ncbi:hypothetical protein BGX34_009758, partial [Mortierella sp. NVP85]
MAGGKFRKPQRGGGRTFSRNIETVQKDTYRSREESEEESSSAESSETSSESESESDSEEEVATKTKKKPTAEPIIDIDNPNRAALKKTMRASDLTTPME